MSWFDVPQFALFAFLGCVAIAGAALVIVEARRTYPPLRRTANNGHRTVATIFAVIAGMMFYLAWQFT